MIRVMFLIGLALAGWATTAEAQTRREWFAARRVCARRLGFPIVGNNIYLSRAEHSVTLFECAERLLARRRARAA